MQPLPGSCWAFYYSMVDLWKRQALYALIVPTSITFFAEYAPAALRNESTFSVRRLPVRLAGTTITCREWRFTLPAGLCCFVALSNRY